MLFIVICVVLLFICLLNYGVDFYFYLKDRYCRFHIGRWDKKKWVPAVEKIAIRWIRKTPTVKITDNSRYMLLDMITGKYRSNTIQSWQKAALILGLLKSKNVESNLEARKAVEELIDEQGSWIEKPVAVDCGMLSYAVMKASKDLNKIKPAMDYSIDIIKNNINSDGMISYTGGKNNPDMYVDTIGLTSPFLAFYAKVYHCPEFEKIAFKQIDMFHQFGLLENTFLPNHAFQIQSKLPLGVYGWGRGVGWYVIGLMDTYAYVQKKEYKNVLKQYILEAAEKYSEYQRIDGGFGSILQSSNTYDSSSTAVLAWFYISCGNIFGEDRYYRIAEKCLNKLLSCTRITGAIDWCQGDTKGIGIFSQTYDIMPFAQGMALRAIYSFAENQ